MFHVIIGVFLLFGIWYVPRVAAAETCKRCQGTGHPFRCASCRGSGVAKGYGACYSCGGSGRSTMKCKDCKGTGRITIVQDTPKQENVEDDDWGEHEQSRKPTPRTPEKKEKNIWDQVLEDTKHKK